MSLYVFDTDSLSLLHRGHPAVSQRAVSHPDTDLALTVISVEEQLTGWYARVRRARLPDEIARAYQSLTDCVRRFARWQILSFTEPAVHRFDRLRALKLNIGRMDLHIAAITLEHGGIVVTRNLRDFQRVPGLQVEDWSV